MKHTIAIFLHHPECSEDCVNGMTAALGAHYTIKTFGVDECSAETFVGIDIVAFPGGIGDAGSYDRFFRRKAQNAVADYVANGGRYLGICMGAYWAGPQYFDLCIDIEIEQYIKQPTADIITDGPTVANVTYNGVLERMYFYDGCAILGDSIDTVVATYANGDAMAAIQGNVGMFGCHPEALEWWYTQGGMDIALYDTTHAVLMCLFVHQLLDS